MWRLSSFHKREDIKTALGLPFSSGAWNRSAPAAPPNPCPTFSLWSASGSKMAGEEGGSLSRGEWSLVSILPPGSGVPAFLIRGGRQPLSSSRSPGQGPSCYYVTRKNQPEWGPNIFILWICGIYFFISSREAMKKGVRPWR